MDDRDKIEILKRRALLLSSALGGMGAWGCGATAPAEPQTVDGVVVEEPAPEAEPSPSPEDRDSALPSRTESGGAIASRRIPKGLSEEDQRRFEELFVTVDAAHDRLQEAERALPDSCSGASDCERRFATSARAFQAADSLLRELRNLARGGNEVAAQLAKSASAHERAIAARMQGLREQAREVGGLAGDEGAWRRAERRARPAPMVCLSVMP